MGQLQAAVAASGHNSTFFMEPGGSALSYFNEVGPRIYSMGPWRDLLFEEEYDCADGYFSLNRDVESVFASVVNNLPQRTNSIFHDFKVRGKSDWLPGRYGLVDLGYFPTKRDITTLQGVALADVTPVTEVTLHRPDGDRFTIDPGTKYRMVVTGTLTDGTDPVEFPELVYRSVYGGKKSYTSEAVPPTTGEYAFCSWSTDHWRLAYVVDMATVAEWQSTDDVATPDLVTSWVAQGDATGTPDVTDTPPPDHGEGVVTVIGRTSAGVKVASTASVDSSGYASVAFDGIVSVFSIVSSGLTEEVELRIDGETVAELRPGYDVPRYRRFKVGGVISEPATKANLLVKRAWVPVFSASDVIHLGNIAAWKHAMLAKVAEDNGDVEKVPFHWGQCRAILDDELAAHQGGARAILQIDLFGGAAGPIYNNY